MNMTDITGPHPNDRHEAELHGELIADVPTAIARGRGRGIATASRLQIADAGDVFNVYLQMFSEQDVQAGWGGGGPTDPIGETESRVRGGRLPE